MKQIALATLLLGTSVFGCKGIDIVNQDVLTASTSKRYGDNTYVISREQHYQQSIFSATSPEKTKTYLTVDTYSTCPECPASVATKSARDEQDELYILFGDGTVCAQYPQEKEELQCPLEMIRQGWDVSLQAEQELDAYLDSLVPRA